MTINFYGERGLVNSIIMDMESNLGKQKKFLKSIIFADGMKKSWIDDVKKFHYLVEPSFAQFGNPDLIMIAEEENGKRHVLFIHAKVCAYNDASEKLQEDLLPVSYRSKAAGKLNIQLAFKYRFAESYLPGYDQESFEEDAILSRQQYSDNQRALKKAGVINLCKEYFGRDPEFLFIALTNDSKDIEPFNEADFLPAIGNDNWDTNKEKFGLVSYEMLETNGVVCRNSGYYAQASSGFLHLPADAASKSRDRCIKTVNMHNWDKKSADELKNFYDHLTLITGYKMILNGSYSIKSGDGRTLVNFFVENNHIQIAFRNDNVPPSLAADKERVMMEVGSGMRSFIIVYPDIDLITDEMKKTIIDFVES